ncbi:MULTISPECIES: phosphate propanoyltransferase [Acetobacterium]|jgi:putative phosphotransacetylase|uniref:Phosphate propanoyltransferase n=1 Tax=Acetobacterium wieringae TaxID=52694 RepID=A0A1F2PEW3_9FIRM|nr:MULTISPECIES: phosphate propanoyltransferase [Acetobacterium]MEA4806602.1 phosphate propanoyltransferase [Acetobacterium wieringae]OFV69920.1 phosphate propanoyltransferase [Acetobacterium wieringae]URN85307.1 phosphate propanoyltransferase [Acetobacterium wieringae]
MNENEKQVIEQIVINTVKKLIAEKDSPNRVVLGISNKHIHLSKKDIETLFGEGYELTNMKDLKQPGQYAAKETVKVIGPKGCFDKVRILGPARPESQIEISLTDARTLGIKAPVCESGQLEGTPGIILEGPCGTVTLTHGVIVALRHIHMPPDIAQKLGIKDKDWVSVETCGVRKTIFCNVLARVSDKFDYEMHLDTDEANAAGLNNDDYLKIIPNR